MNAKRVEPKGDTNEEEHGNDDEVFGELSLHRGGYMVDLLSTDHRWALRKFFVFRFELVGM